MTLKTTSEWASKGSLQACVIALLAVWPGAQSSEAKEPRRPVERVTPPETGYLAKTPAEWSALWWQWALRIPASKNPLLDDTGIYAAEGQSGSVWFLGGTYNLQEVEPGYFTGQVERTAPVLPGKVLFFPIIVSLQDNLGREKPLSVSELRKLARGEMDRVVQMSCEIDGQVVAGLDDVKGTKYRVQSPSLTYRLPEGDNLRSHLGLENNGPGRESLAVSDGVFLFVRPLTPGEHLIRIKAERLGTDGYPDLSLDITNHVMVAAKPPIVSPQGKAYGKTYGEWSALHWKWVYETPVPHHPLFDPIGVDAAVGQSGPVWFLGGAYLYEVNGDQLRAVSRREIFVPAGKPLFFPIIDGESDNVGCPEAVKTVDELRQAAADLMKTVTNLSCRIDGWPVRGIENAWTSPYRVQSEAFGVTLPSSNIYAWSGAMNCAGDLIPAGPQSPLVADGVFLMLKPMPRGKHTINFSGDVLDESGTPYFRLDIRYTNFVYNPPKVSAPDSKPYGKSYAEWSALWWQWALGLPVTHHPLFDTTGEDAAVGQSGPVWFLGGTYRIIEDPPGHSLGVAVRRIKVPAGTALFFPIINNETDNVGLEKPLTEQELYDWVRGLQDKVTNMVCTIDGWLVPGLTNGMTTSYRVQSPVFSYTLPEDDNIYQFFGYDVKGFQTPAVSDGAFVMVEPLEPGEHAIHFKGDIIGDTGTPIFSLNIRYDIEVSNGKK